MSKYSIGIYSDDYLLLLELISLLERELPEAQIKIFGGEALMSGLPSEVMEYISSDSQGLMECDLAVILSKLDNEKEFYGKYDGSVVDLSGSAAKYDDRISLNDPLISLLSAIARMNSDLNIVLDLPVAVYGKAGVDMLMQETRSVYAFDTDVDSVLDMRIAFNRHFYPGDLPLNILKHELDGLRKLASLSVRISPVSTVFTADIYSPSTVILPDDIDFYVPDGDFSLEDVSMGAEQRLVLIRRGNMCTIMGDYLHLKVDVILTAVKTALGGV